MSDKFIFYILLSLFFASSAQAKKSSANYSYSGRLSQTLFYEQDFSENKFLINRSSLYGQVSGSLTDEFIILGDLEVDYFNTADLEVPEKKQKATLRSEQAYIDWSHQGLGLKLGQQIISWGSSDVINPTDFFGSKDLRYWSGDIERKKRGLLASQFSWTPSNGKSSWNFLGVVGFQPPHIQIFVPQAQLVLPSTVIDRGEVDTDSTKSPVFGFKVAYTGSGWDGALVGYSGLAADPEFQFLPKGSVAGVGLVQQKLSAVGYNLTSTYGSWIFRSEGALKKFQLAGGDFLLLQRDYTEVVLGAEYSFLEDYRVQVQGYRKFFLQHESIVDNPDPQKTLLFSQILEVNKNFHHETADGSTAGTFRLSGLFLDSHLELQYFVFYFFERQAGLQRPTLQYNFDSGVQVRTGLETYDGEANTLFGSLAQSSNIFLELNYLF